MSLPSETYHRETIDKIQNNKIQNNKIQNNKIQPYLLLAQNNLNNCTDAYILSLLENNNLVDNIITCHYLFVKEKGLVLERIFQVAQCHNLALTININSNTISKLLQIKETNSDYYNLFMTVMNFCNSQRLNVFGYKHLYNLVLQIWMDDPQNLIDTEIRKKMIMLGFNHAIPKYIFEKISDDIDNWFSNLGKNTNVTEMVSWLCGQDPSNQLINCRLLYEKTTKESAETTKMFQKLHNMTKEEYDAQQEKAKKNGLCKFVRENQLCPHGVKCIFYHGKIMETYGVQLCRNGERCIHLKSGDCKYLHPPSNSQYAKILALYGSFGYNGKYFKSDLQMSKHIDYHIRSNPFVILQKYHTSESHVDYSIPTCPHKIVNSYGVNLCCNKPVKFMSKNNDGIFKFYCCYEHLNINEPNCSFVVKQNITDRIINNLENRSPLN